MNVVCTNIVSQQGKTVTEINYTITPTYPFQPFEELLYNAWQTDGLNKLKTITVTEDD